MTKMDLHKLAVRAHKSKLTLREALGFLNDEDLISVGSGSGYFEICTKRQFLDEANDLDKQFYKKATEAHKMAAERWSACASSAPAQSEDAINDWLKWEDELKNKSVELKNTKEWHENYPSMLDRHVLDIFEREAEEGIAIHVEGPEVGKLWFEDDRHNCLPEKKEGVTESWK